MNFNVECEGVKPPTETKLWIVVPLSRREMLSRVIANYARQIMRAKLCIVENGDAIGVCKEFGYSPDALLISDTHQSSARNEGLAFLRKMDPDAYWLAWDDDDYYSPLYVAEHAGLAKRGQVVGKATHWVLFEEQFLALFRPWEANGSATRLNGATLGAYVSESPEFRMRDSGEDELFVSDFRQKGGKAWQSSPFYTAYCRRGDGRAAHTFKCQNKDFLRCMGGRYLAFAPDRLTLIDGSEPIEGGDLFWYPHLPQGRISSNMW